VVYCKWRVGLSGASQLERLTLIEAEWAARERAFGEAYQERCEALGSLLCDAVDLAVRGVRTEWCRYEGNLLIRITVYHRSAGRVRTFYWRKRMPKRQSNKRVG
jgi:hypothetical protein